MWQCVHLPVLYGIKSSPERRSVTWTSALTSWGRPLHSSSCSRVLWNWWKSSHPRSKGPQPKNVFKLQRRFGGTPVSVFPYTQSLCLLVPMEGHSNWLQVKKKCTYILQLELDCCFEIFARKCKICTEIHLNSSVNFTIIFAIERKIIAMWVFKYSF